jgi:protein disulfide-isomerase-like protein
MSSYSRVLLLLAACLIACSFTHAAQVTTLTTENFDTLTAEGKWILDFFAPWCPHCQQLEPVFEEAAIKVAKSVAGVRFGQIDCTADTELAERFKIDAYPAIKYYRKGVISDYEGGREVADFFNFAKLVTGPSAVKVKDEKDLNKLRSAPVSFVLFYKSDDDLKAFTSIAEKYQDSIRFAVTKEASLLKDLPENSKVAIVWFNDADPEVFGAGSKSLDVKAAEEWILARKYPHFVQYDATSWKYFSGLHKPLVVGVLPSSATASNSALFKKLQQISVRNKDFVFGRLDGSRYDSFVNKYTDGAPGQTFFVINPFSHAYWFNQTIASNVDRIEEYLDAIHTGKIPGQEDSSILDKIAIFVSSIFGDVLEEPLILGLVVVVFIIIVIVAVWFLSEPGAEENNIASKSDVPTSKKPAVNVTIEKPASEDPNRPNKMKKD